MRTFHEVLALIAAGQLVSPLNAHVTGYYTYPGVVYLPIHDAPPTEWALVWRTDRETPLVRSFAELGQNRGPQPIKPTGQE